MDYDIISIHIHQFLQLKEQMEEHVRVKAKGMKHTAPHLQNKLCAIMTILRDNEVHLW